MVPQVAFHYLHNKVLDKGTFPLFTYSFFLGYLKIIFTSATLPKKDLTENLTGLMFQKHLCFK